MLRRLRRDHRTGVGARRDARGARRRRPSTAALRGEATDLRAKQLAASGKMQAINLSEHPDQLAEIIRGILSQLLLF